MFEIERKAIKVKLALNTDIASKSIHDIQQLTPKAAKLKENCFTQIEKWRAKLKLFLVVRFIPRTFTETMIVSCFKVSFGILIYVAIDGQYRLQSPCSMHPSLCKYGG
jgi:hypothetical protein